MKKLFQISSILALTSVIAFAMAGCSTPSAEGHWYHATIGSKGGWSTDELVLSENNRGAFYGAVGSTGDGHSLSWYWIGEGSQREKNTNLGPLNGFEYEVTWNQQGNSVEVTFVDDSTLTLEFKIEGDTLVSQDDPSSAWGGVYYSSQHEAEQHA